MIIKILLIIFAVILVIGIIIAATCYSHLMKVYKRYDKEFVYCNLNGLQFTDQAIDVLGLDSKIMFTETELGDCYSAKNDIVVLSKHTASTSSVASICISAHELGHAVQNKNRMMLFEIQECFVILGKIASILFWPLLIAGVVLLFFEQYFNLGTILIMSALGSWAVTYILKLLTIPVEFNASKIAYNFLKKNKVLNDEELKGAKKVLNAAA